jgi:hypothetical protein
MSAIIGTDLETGMTTITFDSTGRMVQFTKGESDDFRLRMLIIKAEGTISKESIGSQAVYALQQLGEAIASGDHELVSTLWTEIGENVVADGVANNIIQKIHYDNPLSLYHINDNNSDDIDLRRALVVSKKVKEAIVSLVNAISDLEITGDYNNLLPFTADKIKVYYDQKVGLSDTASREKMAAYFEGLLKDIFDADDCTQMRQDFFMHL